MKNRTRTLFVAAATLMPVLALSSAASAGNGNSDAAHACKQGGYLSLEGSDDRTFANVGECVSYAAHGGELQPLEHAATFTDVVMSACNNLTWGYSIGGGTTVWADNKPGGCFDIAFGDVTTAEFAPGTAVEVYLRDNSCGGTVYAASGNHGRIVGSNPSSIDIADADLAPACIATNTPRPPGVEGNLSLTRTIG
jgi:hypothetical protein